MTLRPLIAALTLGLAAPALAGDAPDWPAVDETTGQIRDVEGLEQLARDLPDSGTVRLRMLQPLLAAGEVERVMETLEWLYDRGYVFSDVAQEQIPKLLAGVDPGRIAERLRAEAEVIEASEVVATIPSAAGLIESVARDPKFGKLIGSSVSRRVVAWESESEATMYFDPQNAEDLSGMAASPIDNRLWISSGNIDNSESEKVRFRGIDAWPWSEASINRIAAPDGVNPSDISIGPDGKIYTSDPLGGGVYFATLTDEALQTLIPPGTFRSPQGLATSADNSKLYVSDYRYGIAVIDLDTRKVSRLASDIPVILDGVDGLWRYKNELVAVQNGDALIYVGNGQWDRYIEGALKEGMEPLPTQIRRLPLTDPAR